MRVYDKKIKPSELLKKIDEISNKILKGKSYWDIYPSITITKEDFEKK